MKKKKSQNKKEVIKKLLLILLLLAIILSVSVYILKLNTEETKDEKFYQYFGGRKIEYDGAIKITKRGEITQLMCKNVNIQLDSTPVYYQEQENKVLFPEDMAKVVPLDNGRMTKVTRFSTIYKEEESIYLQSQNKEATIEHAFLYDGGDLYFFIENVTLTVGNKTYDLSPFSYIIATYNDSVEIYNYANDEYIIIPTTDKVIVQTGDYTIDTMIDTIKYGEKEQLLLKNINNLSTE